MYEFIFKMLSEGDAALPTRGMGAIPAQLAEKFPVDAVRLNTHVEGLQENQLNTPVEKFCKPRPLWSQPTVPRLPA